MSEVTGRLWAVSQATSRNIRSLPELSSGSKVVEVFGSNTFDITAMKEKLPKPVFKSLQETIRRGSRLDPAIAHEVAHAIKEWALGKGASHFCHWFQPQTGLTAEKHDAFLTFDDDGHPMERFSGAQLIQSEPDASSFPSGGMRSTFEARGYTAWDPSSPIFILDGPNGETLCVPSVFISYHGDALDNKTPLLRSMEYLSEKALGVLRLFGQKESTRVVPTMGPEQEYFLIDKAFYSLRPDLVACGRTLIGAKPPKGQELEDHYFGSIKDRILACMQETENELFKLGVPVKTRHNEVAPSQYESAPIFEEANVASDHNQMVMETMGRVARRHHLALLLHQKHLAGILGIRKLPEVARDQTDRNRTSPFAFTGNKFEFRAVSSAQSISLPIAFLNAAVGEALGEFEDQLTLRTSKGASLQDAVLEVVREAVVATKDVRFEG